LATRLKRSNTKFKGGDWKRGRGGVLPLGTGKKRQRNFTRGWGGDGPQKVRNQTPRTDEILSVMEPRLAAFCMHHMRNKREAM